MVIRSPDNWLPFFTHFWISFIYQFFVPFGHFARANRQKILFHSMRPTAVVPQKIHLLLRGKPWARKKRVTGKGKRNRQWLPKKKRQPRGIKRNLAFLDRNSSRNPVVDSMISGQSWRGKKAFACGLVFTLWMSDNWKSDIINCTIFIQQLATWNNPKKTQVCLITDMFNLDHAQKLARKGAS